MPDLIILRLAPSEPMAPNDFKTILADLTITAYDLSFADSVKGALLGKATGLADPHLASTVDNSVDINNAQILQHYIDAADPPDPLGPPKPKVRRLESAATAVIVVDPAHTSAEYPTSASYDLRLELSKGSLVIAQRRVQYNVSITTQGTLSTDQTDYFHALASAFVTLPASAAGRDPNLAFVDLPPDGQPPLFGELVKAIDQVLAKDPGGATGTLLDTAPLTPAQCRQIANEIVWNRTAFPPPQPDPTLGFDPFGALYTKPKVDPYISDDNIEKARGRFDAELNGYYGTHEAEALRLAGFVYSAAAAIAEERLSIAAGRARLDFPLITGAGTATTVPTAGVVLTEATEMAGLKPSFVVPAAYFYALAAQVPSQVGPEQRFDMARLTLEPQLLTAVEAARDGGVIITPAAPSTVSGTALTAIQVARRLHALGGTSGLAEVPLAAPIDALITDWLAHDKPTATIDADFWQPEATTKRPAAYLELLLLAVTGHSADLIKALKQPPLGIDTVAKLVAVTDKQWRDFFAAHSDLLPPFTAPGTPAERTEAFIRHLRRFFTVNKDPGNAGNPSNDGPPMLGRSGQDVFTAFANAYPSHSGGTAFTFAADPDPAALAAAVADALPDDPAAQRWLTFALNAIRQLWMLTDIGADDLRFSLIEALYARGFTDAVQVARLSLADFRFALSGSVAYKFAAAIYHQATEFEPYPPAPPGLFQPVNPNGSLIDCVPPEHLSPLGPVAYLHELLQASAGSTCQDPRAPGEETDLGAMLAARRGPVGELHATTADLTTQIPVIDLVNESLEALVTQPTGGAGVVYDTATHELAGHRLAADGIVGGDPWAHDPDTLFAALPQHSSPATPIEVPAAYDILRSDFTDPALPYPQALDINRSYLHAAGSSRYSAMRHFRKDITEFAIDAEHEPDTFVPHQWRFPLRLPLALEYLRITPEESELLYHNDIADVATPERLVLREVYGFPADHGGQSDDGDEDWLDAVRRVPEFLRRTGLDYCEFLALWECGFVPFGPGGRSGDRSQDGEGPVYPPCQPCCPDDLTIDFGDHSTTDALRRLAVFIRLWRRLRENPATTVTFDELSDICTVLELFHGPKINPQFLHQLCALFILRELLCLPLADPDTTDPSGVGTDRTHLLALWVGPDADHWNWALRTLIDGVEDSAERVRPELADQSELAKLMAQNLAPLSRLAGFDPDVATDTWYAQPTSTLRFAEVLLKIYLSEFTVGEVLFLFADAHLDGDDPFPLPTQNESLDDPLGLADDEDGHGLWALRRQLLEVTADDADTWTLSRIGATLADEFGYLPTVPADSLLSVAERFFPSVLEFEGTPVPPDRRRFATPLAAADTTPAMWNAEPEGPLHYDIATQTLWTQLPLDDAALAERLSHLRPLTEVERKAVSELYFAPRAALVPFALLFGSFESAVHTLVHEPDEQTRFAFVQREFALFHRRCQLIAEHLADHVRAAAPQHTTEVGALEVARLLRALHGDENNGHTPWEDDSGKPPALNWPIAPTGGAYAALLGLLGTGLLGEFSVAGNDHAWRELSGPLSMFGAGRNEWNAPVPTVIPAMDLTLTPEQLRLVAVRNGFALRDEDGEPLFGAEPFTVTWSGSLLVEHGGRYEFAAGEPTPDGAAPDCDHCDDLRWRITLRRGQRSWILLNRNWPGADAPDCHSAPIELRRGAYEITVEFDQPEPRFDEAERVRPRHTGFQVKYTGPDTGDTLLAVPHRRLYRNTVDMPLDECVDVDGAAQDYLHGRYTSSLRDIRRTYQRAFKSVLVAHRLGLSAATLPREPQSELGYLLDHPEAFAGQTYPRTRPSSFGTHRAWLDLDLLPVTDPYRSPSNDQRAGVSGRRQAALFDWWERLYDYTGLRAETKAARERPAWRIFLEAAERQPDEPAQLVRHIGVDVRHAPLVLTYFAVGGDYHIATPDLESEAWAVRVWRGEMWLDRLERRFRVSRIEDAKPARWASDRPEVAPDAGNDNLTRFVQDGCFENDSPRRYLDVQALNDGLRVRARDALVAWLCGMNRVPLPFAPGRFAARARDLSDLLLQDVETGTSDRASRIQDAISSAQAFVQRARLGLEPGLTITVEFAEVWDGRFESFLTWQCVAEREQYRENWIEWDELAKARRVEAFTLLEAELRRRRLTVAAPGGTEWWPGRRPPAHPGLTALQAAEPSRISLLLPGPLPEGVDLLGAPADARPSWLAPVMRALPPGDGDGGSNRGDGNADSDNPDDGEGGTVKARGRTKGVAAKARGGTGGAAKPPGGTKGTAKVRAAKGEPAAVDGEREANRHGVVAGELSETDHERLPLWIKAAVRLGTRFVRVAAAGIPPAGAGFVVCGHDSTDRCATCAHTAESVVDEYYFWLEDARSFDAVHQDADAGRGQADEISDWHRPERLPALLDWPANSVVHLVWSRARDGRFEPARRSTEPVVLNPQAVAQLVFTGRAGDSLHFQVIGGHRPKGHEADPTPPGFRYDLATDAAITVPQLAAPPAAPPGGEIGGLDAYPFFAYVCPGAPIEPLTLFSVATTVGGALRTDCKFEAALKWYELVRVPGATDNTWAVCVNTAADEHTGSDSADGGLDLAVSRRDQTCCPTGPVNGERARDRALLLRYLETMLAWADALRCRNNPEATRRAEIVLTEVDRILCARPEIILAQDDSTASTVRRFIPRRAPLNPRLLALYDRTADRLATIRECVNGRRLRDGTPGVDMRYFGDDPRRDGWQLTGCACGSDGCCEPCCEPYRFTVLVQRARELAGEVRALGGQLLAAHEKADAEYLAALRQTQERQLVELTLEQRRNQWRDADWQVQSLGKTKEGAQTRLRYYQSLIAGGLNSGESGYEALTGVSMGSRIAGNVLEAIAQGVSLFPDLWIGIAGIAGTPLMFSQWPVGNKLGAGFSTAARILNAVSDNANTAAGLSNTEGSWDRRLADWRQQVDVISIEIEQMERQILGAERRRDMALTELNTQQRQVENAARVQDFLRDKFTSHEMYLYLQQETAAQYFRMYELARCAARKAERAFNYERGYTTRSFVGADDFDNLRAGLTAGERLQLAVAQMDKAYLDENCREYELTKHISLRQAFPLAFVHLQATGYAEIELPEWMFDVDYPGHYLRRIKNVTVTIPCVVGPYTGVHCRLTLLSSHTRVDPRLAQAPAICCDKRLGSDCGCTPSDNGYATAIDDGRVLRSYTATEAIATSSGQNDSGMFELNFRDERYLPFEFAGAVGRWRIELPPETNYFDFDALSDVVLHLNYTAREGGEALRNAALAAAQCRLPGDGLRLFDVRRDLPDAWQSVSVPKPEQGPWNRRLDLRLSGAMFPFVPAKQVRWAQAIQLFIEAPCAEPSANIVLKFRPGRHEHSGEACQCGWIDVHCVASSEYPALYWGVVDLDGKQLGPLQSDRPELIGTVEFPDDLGKICDAQVVVGYCAEPRSSCGHGDRCSCRAQC